MHSIISAAAKATPKIHTFYYRPAVPHTKDRFTLTTTYTPHERCCENVSSPTVHSLTRASLPHTIQYTS